MEYSCSEDYNSTVLKKFEAAYMKWVWP